MQFEMTGASHERLASAAPFWKLGFLAFCWWVGGLCSSGHQDGYDIIVLEGKEEHHLVISPCFRHMRLLYPDSLESCDSHACQWAVSTCVLFHFWVGPFISQARLSGAVFLLQSCCQSHSIWWLLYPWDWKGSKCTKLPCWHRHTMICSLQKKKLVFLGWGLFVTAL
jgi:hypothetical protein